MPKSHYLQKALLNSVFRAAAFPTLTTIYAAAMTVAPTDAGGGTEVTGGGYARVAVSADFAAAVDNGAAAGATITSNAAVVFPTATANWGTVVDIAFYDAATGGNLLLYGALSAAQTVNATNTLSIPSGSAVITES